MEEEGGWLEMPHECRLVNVFGVWVWLLSVFTSLPFVLLKWHGYVKGGVDGAEAEKEIEGRGERKGRRNQGTMVDGDGAAH